MSSNLVDPEQGHYHAKFERSQANVKLFVKRGNVSVMSLEYVRYLKVVHVIRGLGLLDEL